MVCDLVGALGPTCAVRRDNEGLNSADDNDKWGLPDDNDVSGCKACMRID